MGKVAVTNPHSEDALRIRNMDETFAPRTKHPKDLVENHERFVSRQVLHDIPKQNDSHRPALRALQRVQKFALGYAVDSKLVGKSHLLSRNIDPRDRSKPVQSQNVNKRPVPASQVKYRRVFINRKVATNDRLDISPSIRKHRLVL